MTEKTANPYMIGRGKLFIDGSYAGNSPEFFMTTKVKGDKIKRYVHFTLDTMTPENVALWLESPARLPITALEYKSDNPVGPRMDLRFPNIVLKPVSLMVKNGDGWSTISFRARCRADETGVWCYHTTNEVIERKTEFRG